MTRTPVTPEQFAAFNTPRMTEVEDTDDVMAIQVVEEGGRKYGIKQLNPFSLWSVVPMDKKPLPAGLEGHFTSPLIAERQIRIAVDNEKQMAAKILAKQKELEDLKESLKAQAEYAKEPTEVVEKKLKTKPVTKA